MEDWEEKVMLREVETRCPVGSREGDLLVGESGVTDRLETAGGAAMIVCFEAYGGGGGGDVDCMTSLQILRR